MRTRRRNDYNGREDGFERWCPMDPISRHGWEEILRAVGPRSGIASGREFGSGSKIRSWSDSVGGGEKRDRQARGLEQRTTQVCFKKD